MKVHCCQNHSKQKKKKVDAKEHMMIFTLVRSKRIS